MQVESNINLAKVALLLGWSARLNKQWGCSWCLSGMEIGETGQRRVETLSKELKIDRMHRKFIWVHTVSELLP
jgi:hypothetical protein